ncbi:hypothetical protein Tco_0070421, partial [Tanacetum coccineum]
YLSPYNCPFCGLDIEDIDHVLVSCQKVCGIWRKVWSWWNLPPTTSFSSFPAIEIASGNANIHGDANLSKATNGVLQICIWAIWNWHNRLIHATGDDIDAIKNEDIFPGIQRLASLWMSARISSKLKTDWNCWVARPFDLFS